MAKRRERRAARRLRRQQRESGRKIVLDTLEFVVESNPGASESEIETKAREKILDDFGDRPFLQLLFKLLIELLPLFLGGLK